MKQILKKIYKKIKQYDCIVIARHISPDPDAMAAQMALRDSIRLTFPKKRVYAVGTGVAKFKIYGMIDKIEEEEVNNALLIIIDVPSALRIDVQNLNIFKEIVKIDHHPFEEKLGEVEYVDERASSASQMIMELILDTKMEINKSIAENLFLGVASDSDRFLLSNTTVETFELVARMIRKTNINFPALYPYLYERPLAEIKFHGYLSQNLNVTENGFAHILITDEIIKEYRVDTAAASYMVNDFNFIKEIYAWAFITHDEKNNIYKINIRSRGPIINEVATRFNGGGHKFASGIRTTDNREIEHIISALDEVCKKYKENLDTKN